MSNYRTIFVERDPEYFTPKVYNIYWVKVAAATYSGYIIKNVMYLGPGNWQICGTNTPIKDIYLKSILEPILISDDEEKYQLGKILEATINKLDSSSLTLVEQMISNRKNSIVAGLVEALKQKSNTDVKNGPNN